MRLWLGLLALWPPVTAIAPPLEGFILILRGLQLRVLAHGLGVLAVQHLREAVAHAQHVRVPAFLEVVPRWEVLESGHRKAFRPHEGDEGEAMLGCSHFFARSFLLFSLALSFSLALFCSRLLFLALACSLVLPSLIYHDPFLSTKLWNLSRLMEEILHQ